MNLEVKNQLSRIEKIDPITNLEEYTTELINIVLEGIEKSVPLAKPSPYNKRWWTEDLSQLRKRYTLFRNQARRQRRYYGSEFARPQYNSAQAAKRDYHSAFRRQKKQHWDEFLDEPGNIWDTCRYIDDKSSQASFTPISGLKTSDTTKVTNNSEMAQVLLKEFFPPLPEYPLSTPLSPQSTIHQLPMVPITEDEITKAVFSASPLKGPGPDTIPALVWQILWPTVKDTVSRLFTASIECGIMPDQWKTARIISLRKPQKEDYSIPGAYRPISLLSTLGKMLEAVMAQRLAYLSDIHSLLPYNHFGGLKQKSTIDALLVIHEKVYQAWRDRKVMSLITFDVKGAFSGVAVDVLINRLRKRRIPEQMVQWIQNFCANRTATVTINGEISCKTALA